MGPADRSSAGRTGRKDGGVSRAVTVAPLVELACAPHGRSRPGPSLRRRRGTRAGEGGPVWLTLGADLPPFGR